MRWLTGELQDLGIVAAKTVGMYVVAVAMLRLAQRRTIAQWTIVDFATAVAIGAVIGRTAVAGSQSLATGVVALVALVVAHRLASTLRLRPVLGGLFDHRVRVLVRDGRLVRDELQRSGLTDDDVFAHLRERGILSLRDIQLVLYESRGDLTVVRAGHGDDELVRAALRHL